MTPRSPIRVSRRCGGTGGQALIEAALVLPLLFFLMLNAANLGLYIYAWITVNNAARTVAEYRAYNGVVVGLPPSPSLGQMQCLLYNEVSTLPNKGASAGCTWTNVKLAVCSTACVGDALTIAPRSDDPGHYAMYSVEVRY